MGSEKIWRGASGFAGSPLGFYCEMGPLPWKGLNRTMASSNFYFKRSLWLAIVFKIGGSWGPISIMQTRSEGVLDQGGAVEVPRSEAVPWATLWVREGMPGKEEPSMVIRPPQ